MENIIVEIDKKVVISFNKKYKDILSLQDVKEEITFYLQNHPHLFNGKEVVSLVYSYDDELAVTIMKPNANYEIYNIIGFSEMVSPEETFESDEEKAETKQQVKILKSIEK